MQPEFTSRELHLLANSEPSTSELDDVHEDIERRAQRDITTLQVFFRELAEDLIRNVEPYSHAFKKENPQISMREAKRYAEQYVGRLLAKYKNELTEGIILVKAQARKRKREAGEKIEGGTVEA